jgi:hypothetical protein
VMTIAMKRRGTRLPAVAPSSASSVTEPVSVSLHTPRRGSDRVESVLGFSDWRDFGSRRSHGTVTARVSACGFASTGGASGAMNVQAVTAGPGGSAIVQSAPGTTCHGPSTA